MSISAITSALQGLNQATYKLENHASRIAQSGSVLDMQEQPQKEVRETDNDTGVRSLDDKMNAGRETLINRVQDIDLAEEMTGTMVAGQEFKANLKVLQQTDDMMKHLLDIFG